MFNRRLMILAAAAASLALAACNKAGGPTSPSEGDMSMGNPSAKVKVVEYASASCPHCARFNNDVFPGFKTKYIDTGKVYYTFKEYLTPPENVAAAGFLVARCAGKDKYFTVLDAIFRSQTEMFQTGDFRGVLLRIAQSAGVTEQQFNACLNDEKAMKALNDRVTRAVQEDKVTGTPTFFFNGKKVAEGEVTAAQLDQAFAEASK
ncbi:DsbA family protein [Phenylobacterium soli]|uniref:DsbA family protein n=1 Tax=Phenylobacterium soli TaxID=2170551 RepID=A0A328AHV8_9CAUL|nr:DsbA family protein [Phenylobacterium soli]RAK54229.1 DsbA family protein [Phenylobacterium soli]